MKPNYTEVRDIVEVPKNTGIEGFLEAIRTILKKPRVQVINIDARGKIEYRYNVRENEDREPIKMDFSTLQPHAVIRNCAQVEEVPVPDLNAAVALGQLFGLAARDHLSPVAFVAGADTLFWRWYSTTTGLDLFSREEVHGVPFVTETRYDARTLVLCASFARGGALIDSQASYKLAIPEVPST